MTTISNASTGTDTSAAELMGRYCDGDGQALRELYRRCAPSLLAQLTAMVRDRSTAEDLLQQTFIKVHGARDRYVRGADPLPWLIAIARRSCLDELRRRKRAHVQLAFVEADLPEISVGLTGCAAEADTAARERAIASCLHALPALPEPQRRALQLTKLEGRSVMEAAKIEGTTAGALRVRAHRGYLALRALIEAASGEPPERPIPHPI